MYIYIYIPAALQQPSGVVWGGRWVGGSRGREHMCIPIADIAKTNITL